MQGQLHRAPLRFTVDTECACCARPIRFTLASDLEFAIDDPDCRPRFLVPMVDFTKLRARSIIDDF